jgi:TonB family protein
LLTCRCISLALALAAAVPVWPGHVFAQEPPAETGVLTKPPKLVHFVEAAYPPDKHQAGVTARVLLSIAVGEDGKVSEVEVVEGAGADFDAAALAAARQFLFEPAEIDGHPAPVKLTYRYDFTIVTKKVSLGPQINFEGVVIERFKKQPLPGVEVTIKDLAVSATTDEQGGFAFYDVPPGAHKIEIKHPKLIAVLTDETLRPEQKRTVKYFVEEKAEDVDEEVVVRAARIKKEAVETRIRTEEARRVPGTQGDTLKVVQNLPGVGRSSFGSGQLVVWGSAPNETRVNVDGVEIPALYHMGGLRSTINSDFVRSIDLSPGTFGAEYGRGLGGLVRIDLRPLQGEGLHGSVAADFLDSSLALTGRVTPRLRLAAAARVSYLDRLLPLVTSADIGDSFPIPRYDDYQARASYSIGKDEDISATFLGSDDHLRRTIPASDPAEVRSQNNDRSSKRAFLTYSRLNPDGSSVRVTPSFGVDDSKLRETFGSDSAVLEQRAWHYGLRAGYRRRLASSTTLLVGLDLQGRSTSLDRSGSVNQPAREGDIVVFGQRPSADRAVDHWRVHILNVAPYAVFDITLGNLTLSPGVRFEPTLIEGDRLLPRSSTPLATGYSRLEVPGNPVSNKILRNLFNPRLQVAYKAGKRLTLTAGAGVYGQPPTPEDMSPVFGNPQVGSSRALHISSGFSAKLRPTLTFEAVGFYKRLYDLVSRSSAPSPAVGQSLTQDGIGRSYGVQLLLRQEMVRGFFGWVTYTLSRSERRDHPESAWRLFDYDQTHVLAVLASYDVWRGLEVGARFRVSSGMPRTPVIDSFLVSPPGLYQPVFGAQNSTHIPAFYQLDLRLEKGFVMQRTKLSVFLDVQNVTNRANPEEIIYSQDYRTRSTISGLPTLAILGARLEF